MSPIDDIILNHQEPPKKKGKGIIVVLLLLIVTVCIAGGAYWYYINYIQETPKSKFFKHIGENNISNILNTDIYYTMFEKMNEQSYKTETKANITTTIENDLIQNIDVSKLEFILNSIADKENDADMLDAKINYSSNEIFNAKLINTKDYIGIGSTEIFDKYIGTSKAEYANSIKRATGIETDVSPEMLEEKINNFSSNTINLDEEYKTEKTTKYTNLIFQAIPEEAVTENENVIVTIDSKTINAKAYVLSLDVNQSKDILSNIFTNLKNDEDLLSKIVTGTSNDLNNEAIENEQESASNPLPNVQVEYTGAETEEHQTLEIIQDLPDENLVREQLEMVQDLPDENLVKEELEIVKDFPDENLVKDETAEESNLNQSILEETENVNKLLEKLLLSFVLNQKIEGTVDDFIKEIDLQLNNIQSLNDGIKVTIYVRNEEGQPEETIKLIMELPGKVNIDVEYQTENKIKINYLQENEDNITVGTSIEMERVSSDVKTKFNIQVSNIEDKKVVEKTQIEFTTEGSKTSKDYNNEAIIIFNDSEGNIKVNIENKIYFENTTVTETLNDENTIFIDKLLDEEVSTLYTQIMEKMMQVYSEKIISLAFIDNNLLSSIVQQPEVQDDSEQKSIIRQKIIDTVSNMMREAEQNGTSLTIEELENLKIDDLNVECTVTEGVATIKINEFTFKIDKNFILTE